MTLRSAILCASLAVSTLLAPAAAVSAAQSATASSVSYRTVTIDGVKVFYREAGRRDAPTLLLLHGFPASSFMYRELLERLGGRFHVIAPDYPGFGHSDAPSTAAFSYTFDELANVIDRFTRALELSSYALYMQDYGGPVGFRLASRHPERVAALIIQNANAYEEGLPDAFWTPVRALWQDPSAANYAHIREAAMSDEALQWNYTHGVRDPARVNPDSWVLQKAQLARPGNQDAMLALLYDYRTNPRAYPAWQAYFRKHQPRTLIVWGRNDVIFPAEGARAYLKDLPRAQLHLLDTGHFALEDKGAEIAALVAEFLAKK